jgi:hypothetical protein
VKSFARVGAVLGGVLGLSAALAGFVVGCSSDNGTTPPEDAGVDATTDTGTGTDSGADTGVDTGTVDSGKGDTSVTDTGPAPDANPPADPSQFPGQVVNALCTRFRECCGLAAGAWDQVRCVSANGNGGGFKNLSNHETALQGDAGKLVTYDTVAAQTCLQDILAFTCPPPAQTSAEYQKARDDCYAALKGTIALNGTGCSDDIHCAAGRCVSGTCSALVGDGGACTKTDDCAYRGTSTPSLFCNNQDPAEAGACVPRGAVGDGCLQYVDYDYAACTGGLCDLNSGNCAASAPYVDPGTCTFYAKDAGTD